MGPQRHMTSELRLRGVRPLRPATRVLGGQDAGGYKSVPMSSADGRDRGA
jgi:hypothetical protein